jgi:hypothetical protein
MNSKSIIIGLNALVANEISYPARLYRELPVQFVLNSQNPKSNP